MTKAQAQKLSSGLSGGAVNTVFVQCSEETSVSDRKILRKWYFTANFIQEDFLYD
ncbi:MAG: hypothetical protein M0P01_04730 [Treponema sp.]|nr:hypothetical protein [Treponema sp.]